MPDHDDISTARSSVLLLLLLLPPIRVSGFHMVDQSVGPYPAVTNSTINFISSKHHHLAEYKYLIFNSNQTTFITIILILNLILILTSRLEIHVSLQDNINSINLRYT
jgi:hypothetical protein